MSLRYQFDDTILSFTFQAGTETEEIYGSVHKAYQDPTCPPDAAILIDLRASTSLESRSIEGLRTLSQFMLGHPERPGRRIAIVLGETQLDRTTDLAASLAVQTGLELQLFDDIDAARSWLVQS